MRHTHTPSPMTCPPSLLSVCVCLSLFLVPFPVYLTCFFHAQQIDIGLARYRQPRRRAAKAQVQLWRGLYSASILRVVGCVWPWYAGPVQCSLFAKECCRRFRAIQSRLETVGRTSDRTRHIADRACCLQMPCRRRCRARRFGSLLPWGYLLL